MTKTTGKLTLSVLFFLLFQTTFAQLKLPALNGVASDVKKVVQDYPNRFINLMGEVTSENTQSTDYLCNFKVNGAEKAFVTRYSAKKEVCSWEALMLTTENFEKAKQKYKSLFSQLNNLPVSPTPGNTSHLKGIYESPVEEKKFTSILFELTPSEDAKKLKVEITMQYQAPMEWLVKVLVYDREREDDQRGETVE